MSNSSLASGLISDDDEDQDDEDEPHLAAAAAAFAFARQRATFEIYYLLHSFSTSLFLKLVFGKKLIFRIVIFLKTLSRFVVFCARRAATRASHVAWSRFVPTSMSSAAIAAPKSLLIWLLLFILFRYKTIIVFFWFAGEFTKNVFLTVQYYSRFSK